MSHLFFFDLEVACIVWVWGDLDGESFYDFDVTQAFYLFRIIGKQFGQVYRLGDEVNVLVKKVDLVRRQLDFQLMD